MKLFSRDGDTLTYRVKTNSGDTYIDYQNAFYSGTLYMFFRYSKDSDSFVGYDIILDPMPHEILTDKNFIFLAYHPEPEKVLKVVYADSHLKILSQGDIDGKKNYLLFISKKTGIIDEEVEYELP